MEELGYLHCSFPPGQHFGDDAFNHKGDKIRECKWINGNPFTLMEKQVSSCDGKAIVSSSSNIKASKILFIREEDSSY